MSDERLESFVIDLNDPPITISRWHTGEHGHEVLVLGMCHRAPEVGDTVTVWSDDECACWSALVTEQIDDDRFAVDVDWGSHTYRRVL